MASTASSITGTAIGLGSLGLMGHSLGMVPKKMWGPAKDGTKRLVRGGVGLLAGIGLLGAASQSYKGANL